MILSTITVSMLLLLGSAYGSLPVSNILYVYTSTSAVFREGEMSASDKANAEQKYADGTTELTLQKTGASVRLISGGLNFTFTVDAKPYTLEAFGFDKECKYNAKVLEGNKWVTSNEASNLYLYKCPDATATFDFSGKGGFDLTIQSTVKGHPATSTYNFKTLKLVTPS